jgi:hypothetical protein
LSVCLFAYLPLHLSVCLFICLPACLPAYVFSIPFSCLRNQRKLVNTLGN